MSYQASKKLPVISCIMPTYGRPDYVNEAVQMFLDQDYPPDRKELVILNDCPGQTYTSDLPPDTGVRVINHPERYRTLGEKRNACIELANGELIAVWDDDDVYLPWRLSYSFDQMRRHRARFFRGDEFWAYWGEDDLHHNQVTPAWVSHPLVLFEKSLWAQVGGYPAMGVGEDGRFFDHVRQALGEIALTSPVPRDRRYFILRGKSDYPHMCMPGGTGRLQTTPGTYPIEPNPIQDEVLRGHYDRLVAGTHRQLEARGGAANPAATQVSENTRSTKPDLSVCVSLKNRSCVPHGDGFLALFPNCVKALAEAAKALDGEVELVVADFGSDDDPPERWIHDLAGRLRVRVLQLDGGFSRGLGLNAAVQAARADRLLLTDADVLIDGDVLIRAMEVIDQDKAWWPIFRCLNEDGSPASWQDFGHGIAALHRDVFNASGGVPEFESWGGEDNLFSERVHRHRPGVRERWPGLRHQWHPEHCRHEHYANPRKWDYEQNQEELTILPSAPATEPVDAKLMQERQSVCSRCSMMHAVSDVQVDCLALKAKVSLARGQCRLRKWPAPAAAPPEPATLSAGDVWPALAHGDSIVLVSNGRGLIGSGLGPRIDRFDQVVRFNNAVVSDALAGDVGARTTLWVHSDCAVRNREAYRAAERSFASCRRFLAVPDIPGKEHVVVPVGAERIPEGVERRVRELIVEENGKLQPEVPGGVWCTTGMIGLGWMLEHYPVVHVAGWYQGEAGTNRQAFVQHYGEPDQQDIPINHDVRAEKAMLDRWIAEGRVVALEQVGVERCRESNPTGVYTNDV